MIALVTGGAGFVGSHLCELLVAHGWEVTVLDNFSSGSTGNIRQLCDKTDFGLRLVKGDCTNRRDVRRALKNSEVVFHLAANPEIRAELCDSVTCFRQNTYATHILLECVKECSLVQDIVFASSSTVYGDAAVIPTPEDYAPLEPISVYGAAKLSSEALVTAYAHVYDKRAVILRMANVTGPRSKHGIVFDFVAKLRKNPFKLQILGDGTQTKSFLSVEDCTEAILKAHETAEAQVEVFNVGSKDQIMVRNIARLVAEEMNLEDVSHDYVDSVEGGRGWKGDVKNMLLDIRRLEARGWKPKHNSEDALRRAVKWCLGRRV